jgi:hypothetical protein
MPSASLIVVAILPTAAPTTVTAFVTAAIVAIALSIPITIAPVVVVIASIVPVGTVVVWLPPTPSPFITDQADLFDA